MYKKIYKVSKNSEIISGNENFCKVISKALNHFIILNLGTNKWYFFNDNACSNEENKEGDNIYVEDINFSPCSLNNFNCFDGTWYKFFAIKIICKN